jgi:predicted nucleic acid-binding protein
MFLLDSNVLSELRPAKPAQSATVRAWAAQHGSDLFYLSAITVLEQEWGILRLERRIPPQGQGLRAWARVTREAFAARILPVTTEIAVRCAALHVPDPMPERDALIAATALSHGLILVTRNVQDFEHIAELRILNPWTA